MKKNITIGLAVFLLSLILPVCFTFLESEHQVINPSTYLSRNNNNNETQRLEKFDQLRIIYHAAKNIKMGRYDSFSTIDDNNVINSFPLYQYYSPALYYGMGILALLVKDIVTTWIIGLWIFSLLYVSGFYLLTKKISGSTTTALLLTFIAVTAPYMTTNILSRYSFSEFVGGACIPMIIYLFFELIRKGKERFWNDRPMLIDYLCSFTFFTALTTFFVLTHNITTLYTPIVLGIPVLVYLFTAVKPNLRSIIFFLPSLALVALGSLFYIIPGLQTQQHLLISDTFAGLLFPYIKLNTLGSLFSVMPFVSPISTTPHLYLQIGMPVLLVAILFLRPKTLHIHLIFAFIIFMIVSPILWLKLPQPLLAIQFPYRLLAFIPILFIFASKKLGEFALIGATITAIIFALIFTPRTSTPGAFYGYDFDMFPSINAWNYYYRGENQSIPAEGVSDPETVEVEATADAKNKLSYPLKLDPEKESMQAVTYRFPIKGADDKKLPYIISSSWGFTDGTIMKSSALYGLSNANSVVISHCLRNVTDHELDFEVVPQFKGEVKIERFKDTSHMFIPNGEQFIPVTCSYEEKENGRIFVFKVDKEKKTIFLPVFYSELNQVLDRGGSAVAAKPFLDALQHSYTVIDNPSGNDEIRIKLYGIDPWRQVSYPVLYLILAMTFLAVTAKIALYAKAHL